MRRSLNKLKILCNRDFPYNPLTSFSKFDNHIHTVHPPIDKKNMNTTFSPSECLNESNSSSVEFGSVLYSIYIVRHGCLLKFVINIIPILLKLPPPPPSPRFIGDRLDYELGVEEWAKISQPTSLKDPPLSNLGTKMALEMAEFMAELVHPNNKPLSMILSSPFLRCLQTINPTAEILSAEILVDDSLFEYGQTDVVLPTIRERSSYFPLINTVYESQFRPAVDEVAPSGAIERFGTAVKSLSTKYHGQNMCLVTHAAGCIAMVAALLECPLREVPAAAPCSIYRLDCCSMSGKFKLAEQFRGSTSHLSKMGKTFPWPLQTSVHGMEFLATGDTASWVVPG